MSNQNDFPIVLKQIFQAMWYTFQKSCEEIISMGFMTLFQWRCVLAFSQTMHKLKSHYLKTKHFSIHAAAEYYYRRVCAE